MANETKVLSFPCAMARHDHIANAINARYHLASVCDVYRFCGQTRIASSDERALIAIRELLKKQFSL